MQIIIRSLLLCGSILLVHLLQGPLGTRAEEPSTDAVPFTLTYEDMHDNILVLGLLDSQRQVVTNAVAALQNSNTNTLTSEWKSAQGGMIKFNQKDAGFCCKDRVEGTFFVHVKSEGFEPETLEVEFPPGDLLLVHTLKAKTNSVSTH